MPGKPRNSAQCQETFSETSGFISIVMYIEKVIFLLHLSSPSPSTSGHPATDSPAGRVSGTFLSRQFASVCDTLEPSITEHIVPHGAESQQEKVCTATADR